MFESYGFTKCLPGLTIPLREFPSSFAKSFKFLKNGVKVKMLVPQDSKDWWYIQVKEGTRGYIPKALIEFREDEATDNDKVEK